MDYLNLKALHIIFIVTWFAGLFYIVRLFIYQTEALQKASPEREILSNQLKLMAKRLWLGITWPSAILTLIMGSSLLISQPAWLQQPFMHIKLTLVAFLYGYHFSCHYLYKKLQKGETKYSSNQLRIWNELATLFLVAIVFLIVVKNQINWIWGTLGIVAFGVILMLAIKIYKRIREQKHS
ncbi:CopD family protein [Marinoscillum furvescens]|uniref:Protoporphyrinogen IX oxidase n=1 Tax=Marinoscillum furvescens DSM 4134 TaxID=1122208 RepID=A0A3D9L2R3_MARFU|nr:CopD family protein [Marinoscillum furvescens]RED99429.1 putative membrane protein [Marinoscillum furvescens DSM 4134]